MANRQKKKGLEKKVLGIQRRERSPHPRQVQTRVKTHRKGPDKNYTGYFKTKL